MLPMMKEDEKKEDKGEMERERARGKKNIGIADFARSRARGSRRVWTFVFRARAREFFVVDGRGERE